LTPRSASAQLIYNGVDITADLTGHLLSINYTDPASGQSDSISVTLEDRDKRWLGPWMPQEGDRMSAMLRVSNWTTEGDSTMLDCGSFTVDDFAPSGPPTMVRLSGVSAPREQAFSETARTKTWEDVTIAEIQTEIAGRYGLVTVYDAPEVHIKAREQSGTADSAFLESVCSEYGLCLKVYASKLVIYDRAQYKAKASALTLTPADLSGGWSAHYQISDTYTGAQLVYTDPVTGEDVTAQAGKGPRWLSSNAKADNAADAQRKVEAALEQANHGSTALSLTILGRLDLASGMTVNVRGWGSFDGKYFIDSISYSIGGGFVASLELAKVV